MENKIIIGDATFYHGDCLEVLRSFPDNSIDAVVTDPPYAIMGGGASIAGKGTSEPFDLQFYEAWFKEIAVLLSDVMKPSAGMWWTSCFRGAVASERALARIGKYEKHMRLAGVGVWNRGGLGMGFVLRKTYECFCVAVMPEWKRLSTNTPDVWNYKWTPGNRSGEHSAEKPVPLFVRAMDLLGGDVILDPFMGIGTSAIACHRTNRKFIGIEKDLNYYNLAVARYRDEISQLRICDLK